MTAKSVEFLRANLLDANLLLRCQGSPNEHKQYLLASARFLAAFYLNYPLLVTGSADSNYSYPTLFDWPKTQEATSAYHYEIADRQQIASCIPPEYTTKLPVQILCLLSYIDEAIYYVDHFNDIRSSILIRLIEEQWLDSIERFSLDNSIEPILHSVSYVSTTEEAVECVRSIKPTIYSLTELDSVLETRLLQIFEAHVVAKMEALFAELALMVDESVPLPRPPPYVLQQTADSSNETVISLKIHCLLEVYLTTIAYTNRLEMELGVLLSELVCISRGACEKNDQYDAVLSQLLEYCSINDLPIVEKDALLSSVFARVLAVVLLIVHRDRFSLAERKNSANISAGAIPYKALLPDDDDNHLPPLGRWLSVTQSTDISELLLFFRIIQEKFGSSNDFPPLIDENIPFWRAACYSQDAKFPKDSAGSDWLELNPSRFVSEDLWHKMNYIAIKWTAPQSISRQDWIQMRLKLIPEDVAKVLNNALSSYSQRANIHIDSPISSNSSASSGKKYPFNALPRPYRASSNFTTDVRKNEIATNYSYPVKEKQGDATPSASTSSTLDSSSNSQQLAIFHADNTVQDNDDFSIDSLKSPSRPEDIEKLDLLLSPTPRRESKTDGRYVHSWLQLYPLSSISRSTNDGRLPIPLLTLSIDTTNAKSHQRLDGSILARDGTIMDHLNSKSSNVVVHGESNPSLNMNSSQDRDVVMKASCPPAEESNLNLNDTQLSSARQRRKTARHSGTSMEDVAGDNRSFFQHVQVMSKNRLRSMLINF